MDIFSGGPHTSLEWEESIRRGRVRRKDTGSGDSGGRGVY